jgi:hypothetical protein
MSIFRFEWNWPVAAAEPSVEPGKPVEPLCLRCVRSQVLRGFGQGQDVVYCNLTGVPWVVPFAVRECNEFIRRRSRKSKAGFGNGKEDTSERTHKGSP